MNELAVAVSEGERGDLSDLIVEHWWTPHPSSPEPVPGGDLNEFISGPLAALDVSPLQRRTFTVLSVVILIPTSLSDQGKQMGVAKAQKKNILIVMSSWIRGCSYYYATHTTKNQFFTLFQFNFQTENRCKLM